MGLGAALALLTALVQSGLLRALDRRLLDLAQVPHGTAVDAAMFGLSLLGSIEVTTIVLAALVLTGAGPARSRRRWLPVALFIAVNLLELLMKQVVNSPSPPAHLLRGPRFGLALSTAGSFPSGHMARLTLLCGLALWRTRLAGRVDGKRILMGACLLVLAVGYSRVYLAHHWASDVAGGILLGAAVAALLQA